jgi:excisionase family DNA binding protein
MSNTSTSPSNMLTTREVAAILHVSVDHVLRLITQRILPAENVAAGSRPLWRVSQDDLECFKLSRRTLPKVKPGPSRRLPPVVSRMPAGMALFDPPQRANRGRTQ